MNGGVTDDGTISDLPWETVFDPAANARALSAIQARGFSAATQLVNRFVRIAETSANGAGAESAPSTAEHRNGKATDADADLILTAWWSLFGRLLRSMPGAAALRSDGATFDLAGESASGGVHLNADGPGRAVGEVWLHNRGADDIDAVALRCGGLLAHDGGEVGADAVRFTPDRFGLPGRSSRGVAMEVNLTPDIAPGRYRGTLLAEGYPDLWLPVTLTLRAPAE
ncbi:MAG TPA: hypothetical protein VFI55_11615 [Mycobacterium sp.]|nr:hypothetical protein [Mycobacterium sp.]